MEVEGIRPPAEEHPAKYGVAAASSAAPEEARRAQRFRWAAEQSATTPSFGGHALLVPTLASVALTNARGERAAAAPRSPRAKIPGSYFSFSQYSAGMS